MPGFDRTGPNGRGPFTGKGFGYCAVELLPRDGNPKKNEKSEEVFDMPRGDGTGPGGLGPMTGRGSGFCAGYAMPGYANRGYFGRGGRGRRNWYYATGLTGRQRSAMGMNYPFAPGSGVGQELGALKNEAGMMKKQLADIETRIKTLEKDPEAKGE